MAKMLRIEEMIEGLDAVGLHGAASAYKRMVEDVADEISAVLATEIGCETTGASFGPNDEGGVLTPFSPKEEGQAWPEALSHLDPDGEFKTYATTAAELAAALAGEGEHVFCPHGYEGCPGPDAFDTEEMCDECHEPTAQGDE